MPPGEANELGVLRFAASTRFTSDGCVPASVARSSWMIGHRAAGVCRRRSRRGATSWRNKRVFGRQVRGARSSRLARPSTRRRAVEHRDEQPHRCRMLTEQRLEIGARQAHGLGLLERDHRGRTLDVAADQRLLAEHVARSEHVERHDVARRRRDAHRERALGDEVDGVADVASLGTRPRRGGTAAACTWPAPRVARAPATTPANPTAPAHSPSWTGRRYRPRPRPPAGREKGSGAPPAGAGETCSRVGLARIELATSSLSGMRSNRLSYSPRAGEAA